MSKAKRPNLNEVMQQANNNEYKATTGNTNPVNTNETPVRTSYVQPQHSVQPVQPEQQPPDNRSQGNKKGVSVSAYFDPAVRAQLKMIAAQEHTTVQQLLTEAINDIFIKRGLPPIAS